MDRTRLRVYQMAGFRTDAALYRVKDDGAGPYVVRHSKTGAERLPVGINVYAEDYVREWFGDEHVVAIFVDEDELRNSISEMGV